MADRSSSVRLLALVPALLVAGCASGAGAPDDGPPPPKTCDFDAHDEPLRVVLDHVVRASGRGLQVDDALIGEHVTLKVEGLPWPDLLDLLEERADAEVDLRKHTIAVLRPSTDELKRRRWPEDAAATWRRWQPDTTADAALLSLTRERAPLREVVADIARVADVDIVTTPGFGDALVTVHLVDVPWPRALEAVVSTKGGVIADHGSVLVVRRWPPGPVDAFAALLRECETKGREVRRAVASGDAAWTAAARRAFRWRIELFEERRAQHLEANRTADTKARWEAEVERPRVALLGSFADLLQGE